jgi:hypothetical protein
VQNFTRLCLGELASGLGDLSLFVADGGTLPASSMYCGVSSAPLSLTLSRSLPTPQQEQSRLLYGGQLFASSTQLNIGDGLSDTSLARETGMAIWTRALNPEELTTIDYAGLHG